MRNLIGWLVVLGIAYFAWTEGWPWLRAEIDSLGGDSTLALEASDDQASRCVALASSSNQSLGAGMRDFISPPVDNAAWMRFAGQVQARAREADKACGCPADACALGREAVAELENLVQDLDGMVRGSSEEFFNPATRQERIDEVLARARAAL